MQRAECRKVSCFHFHQTDFIPFHSQNISSYVLQKQAPEKDTTFSNSLLENWNAWILSFVWMNKNATTMSVVNISALHSWWWKTASKSQCETDTDSILLTLLFPFNREVHRVAGDISMKVVTRGGGGVELTLTSSLAPNNTVLSANFQTNWLTLTFVFLCGELVRGKDGDGHCCLGFISMTDCSNDSLFKWQCKTWHCPPLPGARWR